MSVEGEQNRIVEKEVQVVEAAEKGNGGALP